MFGSFVGAETKPAAAAPVADTGIGGELAGIFAETANTATLTNAADEKRSTADIMSLFGPTATPAAQIVAPGGFAAFGIQPAHQPATKQPSLGDSNGLGGLQGLNFNVAQTMPVQQNYGIIG